MRSSYQKILVGELIKTSIICPHEQSRPLSSAEWRIGLIVAGTAAALFAAYCLTHSWLELAEVSPRASLRWGLLAGGPVGGVLWLLWSFRRHLATYAARSLASTVIFLGSVLLLLLIGGPVLHVIAAQELPDDLGQTVIQRAFDLLPLGVAATAALGASLIAMRVNAAGPRAPVTAPQWLTLSDDPKLTLRRAEVVTVRAAGNYCEVQAGSRVHLVRAPMKVMAAKLAPYGFLRVHRSTLINLDRLQLIEGCSGNMTMQLDDGSRVQVGRAFRSDLEAVLLARSSLMRDARP